MTQLIGDTVAATDGEVGTVEAVFFDDQEWEVCYLVVNTTGGLAGHKVLIPPHAVDSERSSPDALAVNLSREQVVHSPVVDSQMPVSRRYEEASTGYYRRGDAQDLRAGEHAAARSHLRTSAEVLGYAVLGPEGRLGHVDDLLVDDGSWKITALAVGEKSVPAGSVAAVDWQTREVRVDISPR